jgi:hypothetical protein
MHMHMQATCNTHFAVLSSTPMALTFPGAGHLETLSTIQTLHLRLPLKALQGHPALEVYEPSEKAELQCLYRTRVSRCPACGKVNVIGVDLKNVHVICMLSACYLHVQALVSSSLHKTKQSGSADVIDVL